MSSLILPGDPEFDLTLATPPPDWKIKAQKSGEGVNFVLDYETGLFRSATQKELMEYLWGGEYDELMPESDDEYGEWEYDMD